MEIKELTQCRFCEGENFETVLNLGYMAPSTFVGDNRLTVEAFPLKMVHCTDCGLVQLKHTLDLDSMYRQYWYKTGLNKDMVKSLQDIVTEIESKVDLKDYDTVVDIGCNDGTLLGLYSNKTLFKLGFDPAKNVLPDDINFLLINDYFPKEGFGIYPKAKVITSIAMFYDLPDIPKFMVGIDKYLAKDGVWVIQFTDLLSMLRINAFDNVCFEHLEYYSLLMLYKIMAAYDLSIFDVSYNKVNGGSLRVYVDRGIRPTSGNVYGALQREVNYMLSYDNPFKAFSDRIVDLRVKTSNLIDNLLYKHNRIYALGASTKGNTLLQYYGLNSSKIEKALEVNPDKFGRYTVGTGIPIVSDALISEQPDYLLILPWHFLDFFIDKYHDYLKRGGKFIVPLPELKIVGFNDNEIWELKF